MIKSMTGFASLNREHQFAAINVTVRAVNHRHLDLQIKMPQSLSGLEARLRARVQHVVSRGRIELTIALQTKKVPTPDVELNEEFVSAMIKSFERIHEKGLIKSSLTAGDLLRFPQSITIRENQTNVDETDWLEIYEAVVETVDGAIVQLNSMRTKEGEYLLVDLKIRHQTISALVEQINKCADEGREVLENRIFERVQKIRGDLHLDDSVIEQEVVRFAARSDISEEIVRLRAHLGHWSELVDAAKPCGRKLDFLFQEMNREINTIGSKAEGVAVPAVIVEAKMELEKFREQVQNVE